MRAPTDKLPPNPGPHNDIIQVITTRVCDLHWCSNCTQLLPFRTDAWNMSPEVFREALRSLEGWPGVRAMFGGNPCTHPKFDELCAIMREEVPDQRQRGLWTNNLLGHGAVARETFWPHGRFNLNVHGKPEAIPEMLEHLPGIAVVGTDRASFHSPILMDWRDMGLTEEEWVAKRETCDINQRWSAAIAERDGRPYAYFCELGASLDGVRGENNGILAVPGWWRWPMALFADQVRQCCDRGCGVPLRYRGHLDSDEVYDVSRSFIPVTDVVVRRAKRERVQVHEAPPETTPEVTKYLRTK